LESPERSEGDKLLPPGQVRRLYGVAASTLRGWDSAGKLRAAQRTLGGHRRYRESEVRALLAELAEVA
jgi:DNA-binding transcriptional MerR regulator